MFRNPNLLRKCILTVTCKNFRTCKLTAVSFVKISRKLNLLKTKDCWGNKITDKLLYSERAENISHIGPEEISVNKYIGLKCFYFYKTMTYY